MAVRDVPVYLFTGFMDGGKTTLIEETLYENGFADDGLKTLIICCEEGDEMYDEQKLRTVNAYLTTIFEEEELTAEKLEALDDEYKPDRVFIEYNGTWEIATIMETDAPDGWEIVQTLTAVDSTTFESYLLNMRAMMMEQFIMSDVVIFNRSSEDTPKTKFRAAVKAKNRRAQIVYEKMDRTIDEDYDEELPYDISQNELDITDADFGIFYMDIMDNPKNYVGKKIHFLGLVYNPEKANKLKPGVFIAGRFAMTCCEDDIQFLGLKVKCENSKEYAHKSWIDITAEVKYEFALEYKGKGPVLYPKEINKAVKPEDELVYFT